MAYATATLAPGYTLTGVTLGADTAPIHYNINGQNIFTADADGRFSNASYVLNPDNTYTLTVNNVTLRDPIPDEATADSILANLINAQDAVVNSIVGGATTVSDTPSGTPIIASSNIPVKQSSAVPVTINSDPDLINEDLQTTSPSAYGNNPPDISDEEDPALVLENQPEDDYSDLAAPPDINEEEDPELGNQNSGYEGPVRQSPSQIPLPMGKDIPDPYDPNLTPEQVASLPPVEQQLRAEELGYPYKGPAVTGLATQNPDGSLTVTARAKATAQDQSDYASQNDWRVRLKLAPGANYLYKAPNPGILQPLVETNGIVFPYTPSINISYAADYQSESLVHTNYRINQYKNSYVDTVNITADFTAQDVYEANYLLAVIHFLKSATKMFYGQDSNPKNGTPPPLCYIFGYGNWQFDNHPLAITQFVYNLPPDVDYIRTTGPAAAGTAQPILKNNTTDGGTSASSRLPPNINPGGTAPPPNVPNTPQSGNVPVTWVPTKIQMQIIATPIISRNDISNNFSLVDYAKGSLVPGVNNGLSTGFW